jgi:protein ImuB
MLWLCIDLPRLPFEALSLDEAELSAVTCLVGNSRKVLVASRAAASAGVTSQMNFATASLLHAALKSIDRSPQAELEALERLANWAYQWSSAVTLQSSPVSSISKLWLEIAASFKLFGGRAAFLKHFEAELKKLHYEYRLGIACSIEGAAVLARAQRRLIAETPTALRKKLNDLSIELLALPQTTIVELTSAGIRTIGECLALPRDAIARRFDPAVNHYLDKLLGTVSDPRPLYKPPKNYLAHCELGAEVVHTTALLFPLRRMLQELQGYLRAVDLGVQQFNINLKHRHDCTVIAMGLSVAARDAEQFFILVRERFERLQLTAPVLAIDLLADHLLPAAIVQHEWISGHQQSTEQLQQVIDKLAARLGSEAIQYCAAVEEHRPEVAWQHRAVRDVDVSHQSSINLSPRPLWLLTEPKPISAPALLPQDRERIESGWWNGGDIRRDYFVMRDAAGVRCWIYFDHRQRHWYVHGLFG